MPEREARIRQHMELVNIAVSVVRARTPASVETSDLTSAGYIGLVSAADDFQEDLGVPFKAYANARIRGAILDELRRMDHLTRSQRRKFKALEQRRQTLLAQRGSPVGDFELAQDLNIPIDQVHECNRFKHATTTVDLDTVDLLDVSEFSLLSRSTEEQLLHNDRVRRLSKRLTELSDHDRLLLGLRFEAELSLEEIGEVFGVTQSRISQKLRKCLDALKDQIHAEEHGS